MRAFVGCAIVLGVLAVSCNKEAERNAVLATGGNPDRGRDKILSYGCGACHDIPGVPGAEALVGPPLGRIGSRTYVAGVLLNSPPNIMRWIQDPPGVDAKTAMPNLHVTDEDVKDIACYLYTLK